MSREDKANQRHIKCNQFENDLFESICNLVDQYNISYSELLFVLSGIQRRWAHMMIEDENEGILKQAESFLHCPTCNGKLIKRRSGYSCEQCKQPHNPFSQPSSLAQEGP